MSNITTAALTSPEKAIQMVKDALTQKFDASRQVDWYTYHLISRQTWEDPAEYGEQEMSSSLELNSVEVTLDFAKGRPVFEFAVNFDIDEVPSNFDEDDNDFSEVLKEVLKGMEKEAKEVFHALKVTYVDSEQDDYTCRILGTLVGEPSQLKPPQSARIIRRDATDNISRELHLSLMKALKQTDSAWSEFGQTMRPGLTKTDYWSGKTIQGPSTPQQVNLNVQVEAPRVFIKGNTRSGDQYFEVRGRIYFENGKGGIVGDGSRGVSHSLGDIGEYEASQLAKWQASAKRALMHALKTYPRGTTLDFKFPTQYGKFECEYTLKVEPEVSDFETVRPSEFKLASHPDWKV